MSKSSSYISTVSTVDNTNLQGLSAVRGDGNITTSNVLDGGAIEQALQFAGRTADGSAKSTGDLLNVFGSLADKAFTNASDQSKETIKRLAESSNNVNNAITGAATRLQNNGIDPQMIIFAVLGVVALILFKK